MGTGWSPGLRHHLNTSGTNHMDITNTGGIPASCPSALRDLAAWVTWRLEPPEHEGGKPRKVPYYASGGRRIGQHGTPTDVAQLVTFDEAVASAKRRKMSGVGFATLPRFGICALDFDNCVADGEVDPRVSEVLATTYAEFSPSGKGVRAFFHGQVGNRKSHGEPFGFETFSSKGFVTFTGNTLPLTQVLGNADTIGAVDTPLLALCEARFRSPDPRSSEFTSEVQPVGLTPSQIDQALSAIDPDTGHDDWLQVGMALHHETAGQGFDLWDEWSAKGGKYPGREKLEERWRSFGKGEGPPVTARSLVRQANEHGAGIMLNGPASADEFEDAVNEEAGRPDTPDRPGQKSDVRFQVDDADDWSEGELPTWIIKGVLPRAELGVMYGASGSGKTFMALDMAAAIALGLQWRGRKVAQGRVVYVAAEASGGFRTRLRAYRKHHGRSLRGVMGVIHVPPNFLDKKDAIDVAKSITASGGADVVVVDTFAQVMPGGDENSGEDVGKALAHCRGIHRATGAMVVLIHHSGKDASKGARGWSGLRAAADVELEVVRGDGGRYVRLSKQKDGADDLEWGFGLEVVQIGVDEDMEPITSCVVVEAEVRKGSGPMRNLGPVERVVNEVVQEFAQGQNGGIEVAAVVKEAVSRMAGPEDGKRDTRKTRATRALESLCKGDEAPYFMEDGCLSLC